MPTIVVMEGLLLEEDGLEDVDVDVDPAPAVLVGGFPSPVVDACTVAGAAAAVYPLSTQYCEYRLPAVDASIETSPISQLLKTQLERNSIAGACKSGRQ